VEDTTSGGGGGGCDTLNMSYAAHVQPVLELNCYTCHQQGVSLGSVTLEGFDNVITYVESGQLLGAIRHDPDYSAMPQDAPKLSDCAIAKITAWVNQGALNN
jgi:hypothetical protein